MSTRPRTSRYSPHAVAPEVLEAIFVARQPVLDAWIQAYLESAAKGSSRYEVLTGPRGVGKSHLIALLGHRLAKHPDRGSLLLARLGEEEHVASLVDLLGRILVSLPEEDGQPSPRDLVAGLRRAPRGEQLDRVIGMLDARVGLRPMVIVLENLERVFAAIGVGGESRLRSLLQAHPAWSIAASSCTWGEAFTDPRRPFYQTFHRKPLGTLGIDECHDMLRRLAVLERDDDLLRQLNEVGGRARVGAIRHLIGGNPRAMALIFPFLRGRQLDDLEGAFLDLAEELTPYFQEQMARRAEGQQPYLEHLASNWYPLSVSELAELTYSTPQTASGQLRYLKRDGLVISTAAGREQYYEVGEPLHRLAWAMKQPERRPAALARFVRVWLSREEVRERWVRARAGDVERSLWELAWHPTDVQELPRYLQARLTEIEAMAPEDAAAVVEEVYLQHPYSACWVEWLMVLLRTHDSRAAVVAAEGVERFGRKVAPYVLSAASYELVALPGDTLNQCREWLADSEHPEAATILLAEHGAPPEVLDAAHARVMRGIAEGIYPETDIIRRLFAVGDPRRAAAIGIALGARVEPGHRLTLVQSLIAIGDRQNIGKATEWVDDDPDTLSARVLALASTGEVDRAITEGERGLVRWPSSATLLELLGGIAVGSGQWSRAETQFQRLSRASPGSTGYRVFLSLALIQGGRVEEARATLSPVADIGSPAVCFLRAAINMHSPMEEDVKSLLASADPTMRPVLEALFSSLERGPAPLPDPPASSSSDDLVGALTWMTLMGSWIGRFCGQFLREPMAPDRLHAVFSGVHPSWTDHILGHLMVVFAARTRELSPPDPTPFLDALASALPLGPAEPVLRAMAAFPTNIHPYAMLASPERAFIRECLKAANANETLSRLPPEGTDS